LFAIEWTAECAENAERGFLIVDESQEKLQAIAKSMGVGDYKRHVFLCLGPDCCTPEVGEAAWKTLKQELKDRGLSLSTAPNACYRTKAKCLRICSGGPIMVVYPEGTWYSGMTSERIPLFVQQHLEEGKPVEEWIFARNALPAKG
jgi:(2Fe-2S) ferredoxin